MDSLGIQALNAGAPDLRLTGDPTQRGTYTQRRRTQMACGGIANIRQIGKPGGLVEPGISKYAWYDFIVDPIKSVGEKVADIIPNELKDPVTKVYDKLIPNELKNPVAAVTLTISLS